MPKITNIDETQIYYLASIVEHLRALIENVVLGDLNIRAYQITLDATIPTKITETSGKQKAKILKIKNLEYLTGNVVYIGDKNVTSSSGYPIYAGETEEIILFNNLSLYGIGGTIAVLERS
jgi:hypothetical protein